MRRHRTPLIPRHADALAHHRRQRLVLPACRSDAGSRPPRSVATRAANRSMVSSKCVKPCRTCPAGCHATSIGASASASGRPPWRCTPFGAGQFGHAAEQTPRRAPTQQHVAVGVRQPEMHAMPQRPRRFRRLARQFVRDAGAPAGAVRHPGTQHAGRAPPACTPSHQDRTVPGRNPTDAPPHRGQRQVRPARPTQHAAWPPAAVPPPRTAAPPRARRCRRPARSAGRTRSPRSPTRCSRRCPAAPAGRPDRAGNRRLRPPHVRRRAGCGRGRSSLALPRPRALAPAARRQAPRRWESALRRLHSTVSSPLQWSAAA